jgi:hypothetical protein
MRTSEYHTFVMMHGAAKVGAFQYDRGEAILTT